MRTFKKSALAGALLLAGLTPGVGFAQMAMENTSFTIGLKTWVTSWNTWFTQSTTNNLGSNASFAVINDVFNRKAESEVTFIPQLTVRNGPWLVSGSAMAKKDFTFFLSNPVGGQLNELQLERKEYDLNVGYALAPGAILTLGWKDLRYQNSGGFRYTAKGPTIGISGSAALAAGISMYGNVGYGRPKLTDNSGDIEKTRGTYILTEVGLAYPLAQMNESLRTAVVTAGYRYQRLSSGNVTTTTRAVNNSQLGAVLGERAVELVDVTEGFTLGASFTF
jgi:hypothetical protein